MITVEEIASMVIKACETHNSLDRLKKILGDLPSL